MRAKQRIILIFKTFILIVLLLVSSPTYSTQICKQDTIVIEKSFEDESKSCRVLLGNFKVKSKKRNAIYLYWWLVLVIVILLLTNKNN